MSSGFVQQQSASKGRMLGSVLCQGTYIPTSDLNKGSFGVADVITAALKSAHTLCQPCPSFAAAKIPCSKRHHTRCSTEHSQVSTQQEHPAAAATSTTTVCCATGAGVCLAVPTSGLHHRTSNNQQTMQSRSTVCGSTHRTPQDHKNHVNSQQGITPQLSTLLAGQCQVTGQHEV